MWNNLIYQQKGNTMKIKKLIHKSIFIIVLPVICILSTSSPIARDKKKWGKVSPEIMRMTVFLEDTTAAAIKVFDIGHLEINAKNQISMFLSRHYRIKILNERGNKYADVAIPYYYKDKLRDIKAQTILPNGKKIKLKSKNIFDEEEKEYYRVKKFALPAVVVGAVIEIKYNLYSDYIHTLEPWTFQDEIPTLESEITLQLAPELVYTAMVGNDYFQRLNRIQERYSNVDYPGKKLYRYVYRAENLPAVTEEPYISSLSNYKAKLDLQLKSYNDRHESYSFIKNLKTLCEELKGTRWGSFMTPTKKVRQVVTDLIADQDPVVKKIKHIYNYVRDQFDDELFGDSIYPRKSQDDILENRKVSNSERNLLMLAMLRECGINANPVLISTRTHGRVDTGIPVLTQYNRTIVSVFLDNQRVLLDASDRFIPYDLLPFNSLVSNGLEIGEDDYTFIQIPNNGIKSYDKIESDIKVSFDGQIEGISKLTSVGYASADKNRQFDNADNVNDLISNKLYGHLDGLTITNADTTLKPAASDTFKTVFHFRMDQGTEIIDDEIYLNPGLYYVMNKNIFIKENREFPIEFGYRSEVSEKNILTFPDGFSIVEIPHTISIRNSGIFYYRNLEIVSDNPLKIQYSRILSIQSLSVPSSSYQDLRNTFAKIVDTDQEPLIVKMPL